MRKSWLVLLLVCCIAFNAFAEDNVYTATQDDESAIDVSGTENIIVTNATIQKTGGNASSADAASFRGINSAVRVYDQAVLTISDSVIESTAQNATGVFAYDQGVINISDCEIDVTGGGAGGVQVAGGGTLYGWNLNVTSASKAAIRSDRGGGVMVLDGGIYTSTGTNGCPAIYSTADITVRNAECASEQSRAVIIEGMNSVTLENVTIEGNDLSTKSGSVHANVLLYQSASGDAKDGTSVFTMTDGVITSHSGAMFYCTNTSSVINLSDVAMNLSDDEILLIVSSGRWGKEGRNGGIGTLNADHQILNGDILVDSISSLDVHLTDSTFTGNINSNQADGTVHLIMDADSSWTLTKDSYLTSFEGNLDNIFSNGYHLYINEEQVL